MTVYRVLHEESEIIAFPLKKLTWWVIERRNQVVAGWKKIVWLDEYI